MLKAGYRREEEVPNNVKVKYLKNCPIPTARLLIYQQNYRISVAIFIRFLQIDQVQEIVQLQLERFTYLWHQVGSWISWI